MNNNGPRKSRPLTIDEIDVIESGDFKKDFETSANGEVKKKPDQKTKCAARSSCSICPCMRKTS